MGWVMMSERELNRIEVLAQVDDGRLSGQADCGFEWDISTLRSE
tara:strand:- start:506 stop:637 length:132 start_codon:yes stop_codon:yes gene_type:complete